jgi:hypothetical protein
LTNIAVALATAGAGEGAATASAAENLLLLGRAELAAGQRSLTIGSRLRGHAQQLVGNSAMQAALELQNLQVLGGYVQRLSARLRGVINPANGIQNCVLCSDQGIVFFRSGEGAVQGVANLPQGMDGLTFIEQKYGRLFSAPTGFQQADAALYASRNADYGIMVLQPKTGSGHMLNWFNLNGNIIYLDFQTGEIFSTQMLSQKAAQSFGSWDTYFVNLTL